MNINQAMVALYSNESDKKRLNDWFYSYCVLADLCHETFEDVRLVKIYRAVSQKIMLFDTLLDYGIEKGLDSLKSAFKENYNGICEVCELLDYKKIVFAVVSAIDPSYTVSVKKKRTPQQQLSYDVCTEAAKQQKKKRNKKQLSPEEQLKKTCEKLAEAFHDYFWKKYWNTKAIHFIKRKRILNRGYDWYHKILSAPDIGSVNSFYQRGKNAIDAV